MGDGKDDGNWMSVAKGAVARALTHGHVIPRVLTFSSFLKTSVQNVARSFSGRSAYPEWPGKVGERPMSFTCINDSIHLSQQSLQKSKIYLFY